MNYSDRELLELAAKAAGLPHKWAPMLARMLHVIDGGKCEEWKPLDDDGDALRLAVTLDMEVRVNRVDGWTEVVFGYSVPMTVRMTHGEDPFAATRRAIVRAAAEIGRAMP